MVDKCVKVCNFPWLLSNAYDQETGRRLAEVSTVRHRRKIGSAVHQTLVLLVDTIECWPTH